MNPLGVKALIMIDSSKKKKKRENKSKTGNYHVRLIKGFS